MNVRSFIALDLPPGVLEGVADCLDRVPAGRLVAPDTLHLTFAFLDDQPLDLLEEVALLLGQVALPGVELALGAPELGPGEQVLWLPAPGDPGLAALERTVASAVRLAGIDLPRRRFRPHVTLARFRRPPRGDEAARLIRFLGAEAALRLGPEPAPSVSLFRSRLGPGGARHDRLALWPLPCRT